VQAEAEGQARQYPEVKVVLHLRGDAEIFLLQLQRGVIQETQVLLDLLDLLDRLDRLDVLETREEHLLD
jgi:hypothetical protein